jgi:hypothetical protein
MNRMKQHNTINYLILFLCILLLGFVYINSKVIDQFYVDKNKASYNQAGEHYNTQRAIE